MRLYSIVHVPLYLCLSKWVQISNFILKKQIFFFFYCSQFFQMFVTSIIEEYKIPGSWIFYWYAQTPTIRFGLIQPTGTLLNGFFLLFCHFFGIKRHQRFSLNLWLHKKKKLKLLFVPFFRENSFSWKDVVTGAFSKNTISIHCCVSSVWY